jgi:hypothetical protein
MLPRMIESWVLWLILAGLAIGAVATWLLLVRLPRDERDVAASERSAEAAWIAAIIERHGGLAFPMHDYDRLTADPHVQAAGFIREIDQPGLGPVRALAPPWDFSDTPAAIRLPACCLAGTYRAPSRVSCSWFVVVLVLPLCGEGGRIGRSSISRNAVSARN